MEIVDTIRQVYTYREADFAACMDCAQRYWEEKDLQRERQCVRIQPPNNAMSLRTVLLLHLSTERCPNRKGKSPLIAKSPHQKGIRLYKRSGTVDWDGRLRWE